MTKPTPNPTPGQTGSREASTPGPWHTNKRYPEAVYCALNYGKRVAICEAGLDGQNPEAEIKANAERIVACINALNGLSTVAISTLKPGAIARMLSEREELLAALKHALAFIEHCHAHGDEPISEIDCISQATDDGPEMECDLKAIRAAIDKATKGGK